TVAGQIAMTLLLVEHGVARRGPGAVHVAAQVQPPLQQPQSEAQSEAFDDLVAVGRAAGAAGGRPQRAAEALAWRQPALVAADRSQGKVRGRCRAALLHVCSTRPPANAQFSQAVS